jgi:hypothetical protein
MSEVTSLREKVAQAELAAHLYGITAAEQRGGQGIDERRLNIAGLASLPKPGVPELTRSADIKLNSRASLRREPHRISLNFNCGRLLGFKHDFVDPYTDRTGTDWDNFGFPGEI